MITVKIGEAFVELVTDGKKLTAGLNDAEKQVIASTNAMSQKFKAIGTIMTVVGGAITASLGLIIKKTVDSGDAFNDMSLRTGVAVETLSALAYAAKQSGTDIEGLETGIKFLTKGMEDASKGTGMAKDAFIELGISIKDSEGNLRPTIEVFKEAATKIAAIENPAKQAALAMELFGASSGTQLVPLLKMGGAGIDELMKKAEELGIVISTKDAQAADEFKDSMNDLKEVLGAAGRDIANILIPPLKDFIEKATEIVKKVKDWADAHKPLVDILIKIGGSAGLIMAVVGPILLATSAFLKMKASILAVSLASKTELIPSLNTLGAKMISFGATSGPIGIMTLAIVGLGIAWKLNLLGMQDDWDKTIKYIKDTSISFNLPEGVKSMVSGLKDTLGGGGTGVGAFFGEIIKTGVTPAVIELTSYAEKLSKEIENLSTSFELSQKYLSENNKSMSDTIRYYNDMINKMTSLDSAYRGELSLLQAGTDEYKKKEEEINKNTKGINEYKAALKDLITPLTGLDLIDAQLAMLGTTAEDNKTKFVLLEKKSGELKKALEEVIPGTGPALAFEAAIKANDQAFKDLNTTVTATELSRLDANLTYVTKKFNEGKPSVSGYKDQIYILKDQLDILQGNLDKLKPEDVGWAEAKTAVEEHQQALKDVTQAMNDLIIGKKPLKDVLKDIVDGFKEATKETDTFGQILKTTFEGATNQINMAKVALSNFTKEGLIAAIVSVKMSFLPLIYDLQEAMAALSKMFFAGQMSAVDYNTLQIFYTKQLNDLYDAMNEKIKIMTEGLKEYQRLTGKVSGGTVGSFQTGTSSVPKTGLAIVHQGEEINPPGQRSYDKQNNNSYSPTINIINPVVRNDNDITKIRSEVNKALDEGKRQFLRRGSELALGM